jgi:hypothetical protein
MNLEEKAVDIHGKKYVLVADRILAFNQAYQNGSIQTELIKFDDKIVVVKAYIYPDISNPQRVFTGYSQAKWGDGYINKTSALENAETSAVGRALAMLGIGILDSVASVDEIKKAEQTEEQETDEQKKQKIKEQIKKIIKIKDITKEEIERIKMEVFGGKKFDEMTLQEAEEMLRYFKLYEGGQK